MILPRRQKTIEAIILNVNEELNINVRDKSRVRLYVFARAVVYDILRKHLKMSLVDISKVFNNNHATVLHSLNQLPYTIKYDPELQHSYNNIINKWLKNVENFIPLSEIDLKNQIKVLINENKDLNLEVTELKKSLSLYTGKYKKYYELVDNISHRVGNNFSDFERKINTLLNGI